MNIIFRRNIISIIMLALFKHYFDNFIKLIPKVPFHQKDVKNMSTQILTKKVNIENYHGKHILIKDKISQIFPDANVHAISIGYDENPLDEESVLDNTMVS